MRTVYKYSLGNQNTRVILKLPRHAHVQSWGQQDGMVVLWAEVNTEEPVVDRTFLLYVTGMPLRVIEDHPDKWLDRLMFIGTVQVPGSSYPVPGGRAGVVMQQWPEIVVHIYEDHRDRPVEPPRMILTPAIHTPSPETTP